MKRISQFVVKNDTTVQVPDYSAMSDSELQDACSNLLSEIREIQVRNEGNETMPSDDAIKYHDSVVNLEAAEAERSKRPAALAERVAAVTAPAQIANLSHTLTNLNTGLANITVTPVVHPTAGYADAQDFLFDVVNFYNGNEDPRPENASDRMKKHIMVTNAIGDDEYSAGKWDAAGVMVPEGFMDRLIRITPETDQLTGRMTTVPMNVPSLKIPALVDKNHSTSFTGGTRVYRTGETLTADKTKDQFEQISMEATELVGEAAATKMLMKYSRISLPALIESSMQLAFQYKMQDEIITGDGNGKFMGFLDDSNEACIEVAGSGTAALPIVGEDILAMRKRMWNMNNAVWVFNWDLYEAVSQLFIESTNNAGIIKLYSPPEGDTPETILGRPIVWTEFMPGIERNTGTLFTDWGLASHRYAFAALVDMSQYFHGTLYTERAQSVHVRFSEREEVFQFVMSNDARPAWKSVLTPKRGQTTRSPFVCLTSQ